MIKAQFSGIKLVPKDLAFPEAGVLTGDFGEQALAEYQAVAKKDYAGIGALNVLKYSGDIVRGSNQFAVVLMNQVVRPLGLRTATPADLEKALQAGLDLRGTYEDSALALRTESNPNAYLAKKLMEQVKARQEVKGPLMIPLCGLELVKDGNSDYGLAFKLRADAEIINAPILNKNQGNFDSTDIDVKTGLPKKLGAGTRTLYTRNNGLSRVYLYRNLDLDSNNGNLANSNEYGRVILASTEGAKLGAEKLNEYVAQITQARDAEIAAIEARAQKALGVLAGK